MLDSGGKGRVQPFPHLSVRPPDTCVLRVRAARVPVASGLCGKWDLVARFTSLSLQTSLLCSMRPPGLAPMPCPPGSEVVHGEAPRLVTLLPGLEEQGLWGRLGATDALWAFSFCLVCAEHRMRGCGGAGRMAWAKLHPCTCPERSARWLCINRGLAAWQPRAAIESPGVCL